VYITDGRGSTVTVIDTKADSITASIPDPQRPWGIAISPDGKRIYTANGPSNDVSVIDAATNRVIKRIPAGDSPWGVAISK
jgi:YVTN family beta-propeller protein